MISKIKTAIIIFLSSLIVVIIAATIILHYQLTGLNDFLNNNDNELENDTLLNNNITNNENNYNSNNPTVESKLIYLNKDYTIDLLEPKNLLIENEKNIKIPFEIFPHNKTTTTPNKSINNISYFLNSSSIDSIPNITDTRFSYGSDYTELEGIISFRGNNFRNQTSYGFAEVSEKKLEVIWSRTIGYLGHWTGVGWTGQPLIVKWPEETRNIMNITDQKKQKENLKEVIYATLDGKIYFMDLDDGENTRDPINVGYPFKGTASLDPRGYPLLYAGQGIDKINDVSVPIGFRIFNLINQKEIYFLDGRDEFAKRNWYAFDSSCLVDAKNDIVYEPGENGIFYKIYLNTEYNNENISINPEIYKYRFDQKSNLRVGIENSMVAYDKYGFFADNAGIVQCIDLNTLSPIWAINLKEDIDASLVLDVIDEENVHIYCGTEVDFQGSSGYAGTYKIDALTGEILWQNEYYCASTEVVNGGCFATPVVDEDIVYFNVAKIDGSNRSLVVALDKKSGNVVWEYKQNNYTWSSPSLIETKDGEKYLIQCDSIGQVILFDASNGNIEDVIDLGTNIEGSPVVYENTLVVGTRGQKIVGIKIN